MQIALIVTTLFTYVKKIKKEKEKFTAANLKNGGKKTNTVRSEEWEERDLLQTCTARLVQIRNRSAIWLSLFLQHSKTRVADKSHYFTILEHWDTSYEKY